MGSLAEGKNEQGSAGEHTPLSCPYSDGICDNWPSTPNQFFDFINLFQFPNQNDRIQGLADLQQPTWINQEGKFERLNFDKPRW